LKKKDPFHLGVTRGGQGSKKTFRMPDKKVAYVCRLFPVSTQQHKNETLLAGKKRE